MRTLGNVRQKERWEILMLYAVLSQSTLGLLQIMLVDLFYFSEDLSNRIRVLLVTITMGYAIIYAYWKAPKRFLATYACVILVLLITLLLFPQNQDFLVSESLKFTLPLVIPSYLCLTCVNDYEKVEEIFYHVSWVSFALAMIYAYQIVSGSFIFSDYSMSFSFSLLLPTLVLFTHNGIYSKIAAFFLFILIVFLGSRSAAIVIALYIFLDSLFHDRKYAVPVAFTVALSYAYLSYFTGFFEKYGVESRTLSILQSDEGLIGHLSHRDEIYDLCKSKISENPMLGIGLYGDRLFLDGSTSHNFFIEVILDFGVFIGCGLVAYLFWYLFRTYRKANHETRIYFIRYFCAVMIPLMVSGSYLKDYNLGLFLGICAILNKKKKATN